MPFSHLHYHHLLANEHHHRQDVLHVAFSFPLQMRRHVAAQWHMTNKCLSWFCCGTFTFPLHYILFLYKVPNTCLTTPFFLQVFLIFLTILFLAKSVCLFKKNRINLKYIVLLSLYILITHRCLLFFYCENYCFLYVWFALILLASNT